MQVGVIGWGVIGRQVGTGVAEGAVPGAELAGILGRRPVVDPPAPQLDVDALVAASDVIVEAAGQDAVAEWGPTIVGAGCDLLVTSSGALADPDLRLALTPTGGGRYFVTSGAIGGLDLLGAARRLGPFERVTLTSTKPGANLIQPWMDATLAAQLEQGAPGVTCFNGGPAEAAARFPQSVNIAATLAEVVGDWDLVGVRVVSGAPGSPNQHIIEAEGPAGHHRFEIANAPAPGNPRSSWVVASAVLRSLALLQPGAGAVL